MPVNVSSESYGLLDNTCSRAVSHHVFAAISAFRSFLILTLSTLVLYVGHQRSFKKASHSDILTFHMVAVELLGVLSCLCYIWATYTNHPVMVAVASVATTVVYSGEMFFHILTCVERYVAVVHPMTYLGLKNSRGIRIRNIIIGCVWLFCFGLIGVIALLPSEFTTIPMFCFLVLSMIVITFCSLSVLFVLIRPVPGEGGGDRSKQRAFYTITAITCTLWLWFVGLLVSTTLTGPSEIRDSVKCVVLMSVAWFNLPSCVMLPLLYLHKVEILPCCFTKE